ncbi:MAG: cell division ATP-binding protein FtsE [Tissierella sp.]|uniref:cell division ATP-binding protein FtsE n=1 Tax=Tissierella sp. TaxID=41274 RepID=UPI003F95493A
MIKVVNLNKEYKSGVKALSDINLHIKKGEFVYIVGESGAGKSTLVKILLKEEVPTSGEIYLNNINITNVSNRRIPYIRRNLGVVFQDFRLLHNKTVYENIAFAMEILGSDPKEIRRRVPIVLNRVDLGRKASSFPDQLSGGEQQRVSIARSIVNNPPILLADEPTGNLDPDNSLQIMKILNDINTRGTTVIMATHAKEIVDSLRRRVIQLKNGVIIRDQKRGGYDE